MLVPQLILSIAVAVVVTSVALATGWGLLGALAILLLPQGWTALLVTAGVALLVRRALRQRLGGTTGDTAGALLEFTETGVLVTLALTLG